MRTKMYVICYIIGLAIGVLMTKAFYEKNINTDQSTIKEKVVTRIIERKDGTKETVIVEDKVTQVVSKKAKINNWSASVSSTVANTTTAQSAVYTLSVDRRILGDLSVGGYVRSDKELGVLVRYSF